MQLKSQFNTLVTPTRHSVLLVSVTVHNGRGSMLVKREREKQPVFLGRISLELKLQNRRI